MPPETTRATVTACLIVRDEAERLPAALASVAFCDEVVVVDSGSVDDTVALARAAGARVYENAWPGYPAQRNFAIDRATCDWILELDADERISDELRVEIESFLRAPPPGIDMGALPIRNEFLGRAITSAARYPGYRYRLFRRGAYRHDESRVVHEGLWSNGPVFAFEGDIVHLMATSVREAVSDSLAYARLEARQVPSSRSPAALAGSLVLRPAAKFFYRGVLLGGWRDGWRGWAKIALDCGTDVTVAALAAVHPSSAAPADPSSGGARGPVRIVAVAVGEDADAAFEWLHAAAAAGADVTALSDRRAAGLRVRDLPRVRPAMLARALDAENQLRPYDAVVVAGTRAARLVRLMPRKLRGRVPVAPIAGDPAAAVRRVEAETRRAEARPDAALQ